MTKIEIRNKAILEFKNEIENLKLSKPKKNKIIKNYVIYRSDENNNKKIIATKIIDKFYDSKMGQELRIKHIIKTLKGVEK